MTKKRKAKKQTSNRVSSLAGRILALCEIGEVYWLADGGADGMTNITRKVKSLAASCLAQDETKGRRKGR